MRDVEDLLKNKNEEGRKESKNLGSSGGNGKPWDLKGSDAGERMMRVGGRCKGAV